MALLRTATHAMRLLAPETAHGLTLTLVKSGLVRAPAAAANPRLAVSCLGLDFPNPLGLAAGFDKNAEVPDAMLRLGFGFVEVGSVTPRPQPGNPRPRLFRLTRDRAVINRMGFNNDGLARVKARLQRRRRSDAGIVGVNLGANKDSADRIADYALGMTELCGLADYYVVNVSSPNTPGLRDLQEENQLVALLAQVRAAREAALPPGAPAPPILLKIAPDFTGDALERLAGSLAALAVDGIVISNTTVGLRDSLHGRHRGETGGLSGRPLFPLATDCLHRVYAATGGRIPLIGVGGIEDGATAYAKLRAGATLLQLYTALVYEGPGLVARILDELAALLARDGFASVAEAVGADHR